MAPARSASPRMTAATPASRRRGRTATSVTPPATMNAASGSAARRARRAVSGSAPPCESTNRRTPASTRRADELLEGRRAAGLPAGFGEALRTRVEPDGEPVAGDAQAGGQALRLLGHREQRQHDARRAGREGQLDLLRTVDAAGHLERRGHGARHVPDGGRVDRPAGGRAVEIDEMDDGSAQLDEVARDPLRPVGGRARPRRGARPEDEPRAPGPQVQAGDDLHQRPGNGRGVAGPGPSPASRRRWKLTGRLPA